MLDVEVLDGYDDKLDGQGMNRDYFTSLKAVREATKIGIETLWNLREWVHKDLLVNSRAKISLVTEDSIRN